MIKIFIYLALFGLLSCTGQKPAGFKSEVRSLDNQLKASCRSVDFHQAPFDKKSIKALFECTKWNKEYPALYSALTNMPQQSWDHLGSALTQSIYADKTKLKKFNQFISYLKSNQGLVEYEKIIQIIIQEGKIFELVSKITNSSSSINLIKRGVLLLEVDDVKIKNQLMIFNSTLASISPHQKSLADFFRSKNSPEFNQMKVGLLDELAKAAIRIKSPEEIEILQNFIYSEKEEKSVFKKWVIGGNAFERFKGFYLLATDNYSQVKQDLNLILTKTKESIECKSLNPAVPFVIYPKIEMESKLDIIKEASHEDYVASLVDMIGKNLSFANFCGESGARSDVKEYIDANYRFLDKLLAFSLDQRNFDFLQDTQQAIEVNPSNRWWILDFIRGNLFGSLSSILNDSLSFKNPDILLKVYFDVLKNLKHEDYKDVSHFLDLAFSVNDKEAIRSWANLWLELDFETRLELFNILELVIKSDVDLVKMQEINETLFEIYPSLVKDFQDSLLRNNAEETINSVKTIANNLSNEKIEADLVRFLSSNNLFKMLDLIADSSPIKNKVKTTDEGVGDRVSEEESDFVQIKPWIECFNQIRDLSKKYNYYQVVNQLPAVCKNRINETGLAGSIFEWMESSNKLFLDYAGYEIHALEGVWSPTMLHLTFGYATLVGANYKEVYHSENYALIYEELAELVNRKEQRAKINTTFDLVSNLLLKMNGFEKWTSDFSKMDEQKINEDFKTLISSDVLNTEKGKIKAINYDCHDLVSIPSNLRCVNKVKIRETLTNLDKMLTLRHDGSEFTLLGGLINFLHPSLGVKLNSNNEGKATITKISDLMRFTYDLGYESTNKEYFSYSDNGYEKLSAPVLSRIEEMIREISFSNNFYGAYFMNLAANASNYKKKIDSMKPLLTVLEGSSGVLRGIRLLPKDTKWNLKNVKQTYPALSEVADLHFPVGLVPKKHNDLVQALLKIISQSSGIESQSFNAIKKPNPYQVRNHNGKLLTEISNISGLSRLSHYLQIKIKGQEKEFFESSEMKYLDQHLFKNVDPNELERVLTKIVELKNEKGEVVWIEGLMNLIDTMETASLREIALVEEIAIESLLLFSDPRLKTETTSALLRVVEKMLPYHNKLNKLISIKVSEENLLTVLQNLRTIRANDKKLALIFNLANYFAPWLDSLQVEEADVDLMIEVSNMYSQPKIEEENKDILSSFNLALQDDRFSITPLISTLKVMHAGKRSYELRDIVRILREKKGGRFYLDIVLDELFVNAQKAVISFLKNTYPALTLPRK